MKPKVGLVLFEGVHIYVVPKTDYDALAARLAEAERRITEALAYDDNMDKTTRAILDGSEQFEQRPADSASAQENEDL